MRAPAIVLVHHSQPILPHGASRTPVPTRFELAATRRLDGSLDSLELHVSAQTPGPCPPKESQFLTWARLRAAFSRGLEIHGAAKPGPIKGPGFLHCVSPSIHTYNTQGGKIDTISWQPCSERPHPSATVQQTDSLALAVNASSCVAWSLCAPCKIVVFYKTAQLDSHSADGCI